MAGIADRMDEIRTWYNGYLFGGQVIYNPWSVLCYLDHPNHDTQPWWANTSSNQLVRDLLLRAGAGAHRDVQELLAGREVVKPIQEDIVPRDVSQDTDALWSFLLFSGYLKAGGAVGQDSDARGLHPLSVPNRELNSIYRSTFTGWLRQAAGGPSSLDALGQALLRGDAESFERHLGSVMRDSLSYYDVAGDRTEAVYHAFIVGLLVHLSADYEVTSNRESGFGRYDVMIAPRRPDKSGVVLELKTVEGDPEETLDRALAQVRERDYAAALRQRGANPVHEMAAVFDGKRVRVRRL
jgi:hypothetical protein